MHNRGPKRRRKRKGDWKCIWINYGWKFPKPKEGNKYPGTGSTEGPKQDEPKQTYTKTYYIIIAKVKDKERILKAAREKQRVNHKGTPIRISADFSTEMLQARRECQNTFKVLKGKNLQPRILYPARLSFRIKGEIKNFSDKQKLKIQQY